MCNKHLLTLEEAGKLVGKSGTYLRRLLKQENIRIIAFNGRHHRVSISDIPLIKKKLLKNP